MNASCFNVKVFSTDSGCVQSRSMFSKVNILTSRTGGLQLYPISPLYSDTLSSLTCSCSCVFRRDLRWAAAWQLCRRSAMCCCARPERETPSCPRWDNRPNSSRALWTWRETDWTESWRPWELSCSSRYTSVFKMFWSRCVLPVSSEPYRPLRWSADCPQSPN